MKVKLTNWDIQDYLKTSEDRVAYIQSAIEESVEANDPSLFVVAIGDVMRAIGYDSGAAICKGIADICRVAPPASKAERRRTKAAARSK